MFLAREITIIVFKDVKELTLVKPGGIAKMKRLFAKTNAATNTPMT